ncbi:MAG TPA: Ig-like domain-containing protein [Thermoanaerobaculia bacterium]|nr:Ig-like domain-containing protein [Thermoanaerobaculia bacterium]
MRYRLAAAVLVAQSLCAAPLLGGEITSGSLQIQGVALEVDTPAVTTGIDIPTTIQTKFGGKTNDAAPSVEGLLAVAELTGPGLDSPIQLTTAPGYRFQIPGFSQEGVYTLQNIRLMKGSEFVAPAVPPAAAITVANILQTSVKVHQLTPDELRSRGIVLDGRNYNVYEYSFTFLVNGQTIEVPFPVVVDTRTHEVTPLGKETPFTLPNTGQAKPPRWSPPDVIPFELPPDPEAMAQQGQSGQTPQDRATPVRRPSIPAAIVIPNSLAVLHQFFAVILTVSNGAPSGSTARLDDLRATIKLPTALRPVKSNPSVAFGQPVPIVDPTTGVTFLVAQAKGEAEWDVEGLQPGTHTIDIEIRATLRETGQADVPLKATPRASIVVHDPRFNLTFSHPDTVRKGIDYSTYTFVTNMSGSAQTMRVGNGVPSCDQAAGANVCRIGGADSDELTLASGEMKMIEYTLRPGITGHVFATAGSIDNPDNITAAVQLHMGVSESGVPLSPATLVMPYYAQFVNPDLVDANLQLLGLGYSVATAPVNQTTAKFPRVIRSDVFYRAADIARAGQRIFVSNGAPDAKRDAIAHLALDLLGNGTELREWDDLRRQEKSGRVAGASVFAELNSAGMARRASIAEFVDLFASATSYRTPYVMAIAHGPAAAGSPRPYALSLRGESGRRADVPNEAASGWIRDLPFSDISRFDVAALARAGEIALVGRWTENIDVVVTPSVSGPFAIEIVFPGTNDGTAMRAHFDVNGTAGEPIRIPITRGATSLNAILPNGGFSATTTASAVAVVPLQIVGGRQDLNLDPDGHKVSILFNRPVAIQTSGDWRSKFAATIAFNRDGVIYNGPRAIFAAAMQDDNRVINLSFDSVLTTNAAYAIAVSPLVDPLTQSEVAFAQPVTPKIDNDRPAAIVYGKFLKSDNTPIGGSEVRLYTGHFQGCTVGIMDGDPPVDCNPYREAPQYVKSEADGTFLFEYIPRDPIGDPGLTGSYRLLGVSAAGRYTIVDGSVRLPGRVHFVNLQLLGRGAAEGTAVYDNGQKVAGASVFVGSTMFNIGRQTTTDASGFFHVEDLPVGPITFAVTDSAGNVAYASGEIAAPGQLITKQLVIVRKPFPGTGTVFGVVRRSDTNAPVVAARVGVYSQGFGLSETLTDPDGRFEFRKVPAGFVTVLAAEWSVSRQSASIDFDLHADEVHESNLMLSVPPPSDATASLGGDVIRENPLFPGDPTKYERVSGAIVRLAGRPVTADSNGHFTFDSLPLTFANQTITAYDPSTKRVGSAQTPTLTEAGPNNVSIFMAANSFGTGTIRARVINAAGQPVTGFRVIEPGFPPTSFQSIGGGLYELTANVGGNVDIWAIQGPSAYGDQYAHDSVHLEFPGQIASVTLRLPGQGTVRAKLHGDFDVIGDVTLSYAAWDEAEQALRPKSRTLSTSESGIAGYATFSDPKVPALQGYILESSHPSYGYASQSGKLAFDGDFATHTLQLNKLASIRGTIYAIDGRTPIAGAAVHLINGVVDAGVTNSQPDGTFSYRDVPANTPFTIRAEATQSGIYRAGIAYGTTPALGGPADGISVIMRRRGNVEGTVVDANNTAVPLAKFWLRELDFPARGFGSDADPITADIAGRFAINNVFVGALRAKAWDPSNQDLRGDWSGTLDEEGQTITIRIQIGSAGTGGIQVTVADPNQSNLPVANAEVGLDRGGGLFDLTTSDGNGVATFQQVPVGTYSVSAYSKALGKSGSSASIDVARDLVTQLRVLLEFSGKVDGALTDPESVPAGSAVPGATVTLTGSGYQTRSSTNPSGAFTFDGVREGLFALEAKDTESNRRAAASHIMSAADPHPVINLELERTETLNVAVYLPDDTGASSGILAPPVAIDVSQRSGEFSRSAQGNPIVMPKLLATEPYSIAVHEIGGQQRELSFGGAFPKGTAADPVKLVYPAFGEVDVTVMQGGAPASGARVTIAGGRSVTLFTDATGHVSATGFLLGNVSAQATSVDGGFSGSASGTLSRQSVPAQLTIDLGAFAGITGLVEAESGGPSAGTRVLASFGRTLEAMTGANGGYTFQGIPTTAGGTLVTLTYIGADGVTIGGRQTVTLGNDAASKIITLPTVKLDATPPQVVSITPADGAQSVSPDSTIRFVFSERIRADQITNTDLQLLPADGTAQVIASFDPPVVAADGTFAITMRPPPPPAGQRFPLKSNTLYRVIVSGAIEDLTAHRLPSPLGITFTTSDYTEPHVIKVVPAVTTPVPEQVTFEFHFNEPVDPAPWQPGGGASFHFYKISAPGPGGQIVAEKAGRAYLDPATSLTLFFAPNDPIESESYYRVVFSGIRDLQGNALAEQTFHFFSFDKTKPFVRLITPVPDTYPLISGVEYVLTPDLRNGTADGPVATDVASVDYFRVDGATETYLTTPRTGPFAYRFVAPEAPDAGLTYSLRARATDGSGNVSDPATISWTVKANQPPKNVAMTFTPATAYPANSVIVAVEFDDEGTFATAGVTLRATKTNATPYTETQTKQVTRATVADPWPQAKLTFKLPPDLDPATAASFTATVTDVRGLSTSQTASLTLLVDQVNPALLTITPAAETTYHLGDKYTVQATASDSETGVAEVDFTIDGQTYAVPATTPVIGSKTFASPQITVPAKNVDTRVTVVVTAKDYQGNSASKAFEIVYIGVNDPSVPKGTWLCPIDRAVIPGNQTNFSVPLRVSATDDIAVTSVAFLVPGIATPIPAMQVPGTNEYTASATLPTTPAEGSDFTLTAVISDADTTHTIELRIAIDVVAVDQVVDATQAITTDNVAQFDNKSILVRTPAGRLVTHVPVTLKNLIVLDGGRVDTIESTSTLAQKVDLTIVDHLYVDCASAIDETAKGNSGGAAGAGGSHGGLGTIASGGVTNPTYDSIRDPAQLGSGSVAGGGTISLSAAALDAALGRIAVAGSIRADGASGAGAGSGGSIRVNARHVIVGPSAHITANGGDGSPSAGGGGRIAITGSERLDIPAVLTQVEARGGNGGGGAGTIFVRRPGQADGELFIGASTSSAAVRATPLGSIGTGTAAAITANSLTDSTRTFDAAVVGESVLLDQTYKVISLSADRHTLFTDPADGPLTGGPTYRGVLRADRIEVGVKSLARFDDSFLTGGTLDNSAAVVKNSGAAMLLYSDHPSVAVTTAPAAGGTVIRGMSLDVGYDASSAAGIAASSVEFSGIAPIGESFSSYPLSLPGHHVGVAIPSTQTLGPAALNVRITDRADRTVDAPAISFNVIDNQPPAIDAFTAIPDSLYPGKSVAVSVSASDDLAVTRLSITSTIGGTPSTQSVTPNTRSAAQTASVVVPITTPGGTPMTIEAAAEDGYPARTATRQTKTITILSDTVAPALSIVAPAADQLFSEGTGATFTVTVNATDAEVGVKSVTAGVGGGAAVPLSGTATPNQWSGSVPVPSVDGADPVPFTVTVIASDFAGNTTPASVNIRVQPLLDPTAPSLAWTCGTSGAMYPAGYPAPLRVFAKGVLVGGVLNGVQKVEFFANGSTTPIPAAAVTGVPDQYEASYTIPALADGTVIPVKAVATSASGAASDLTTQISVIADGLAIVTSNVTLDATNASSYDGKSVVVQSGTLTVVGAHSFDRLIVLNGATATHPAGGGTKLDLTMTRRTFVACGGSIDVTGRGYPGSQTNPFATPPGNGGGGAHIGIGGLWNTPAATSFGKIDHPQESGGGGEHATAGSPGGGIIRLSTTTLLNEGAIRANGASQAGQDRGGAGGSVWMTATKLIGGGTVEANGSASATFGAGAGGAIAIEYTDSASVVPACSAKSGGSVNAKYGGAGAILISGPLSAYGDLTIDNGGRIGQNTDLPSLGGGIAQSGSSGATLVTDRPTNIADFFAGHWIEITDSNGVRRGIWRVGTINGKTVTLLPNGAETMNVAVGDAWRGVFRFDSLKLRSSTLQTQDRLLLGLPADLDASSSIVGNNQAAPLFDTSKIAVQTSPTGSSVIGRPGAVTDADPPIALTATNTRTGQTWTGAASGNGSLALGVQGNAGDTITLQARDANIFPLTSPAVVVGTLGATTNTVPTQLDKSAWTTDAGFKPQTIALNGAVLAVSSASGVSGSTSDKLVVLDVSDPAHPAFVRTVSTVANVRDVTIVDGWAYIAGDRFGTLDLRNTTSAIVLPCDTGGVENAVAVAGGYAFTAENSGSSDGRIYVYDTANPAAPRCISEQTPLAGQSMLNTIYTDLIAWGADYLVGISNGASGWDVVVIDRRDISALRMAGRLQIPNFTAWRARLHGSMLYVVSTTTAELAIVDLSNPALPVVAARLPIPVGAGGISLLDDFALIADTTNGLLATTIDPAPPAIAGDASTTGNAMDVAATGGYAYVANETGVAVVPISVAPVIDRSRIAMSLSGTMVTVTGARRAVTTGSASSSVQFTDTATAASVTLPVNADGTFSASLPASGGDTITIKATDSDGRASGPLPIGTVPFGTSATLTPIVIGDANFHARAVKVEGTLAAVSSWNSSSSNLVVFDTTNPAPVQTRVVSTVNNVRDFELINGWAYIVGDRFGTIDLRSGTSTINLPCDTSGVENAIAVAGGYAFTAENSGSSDGRIYVYDVANPAAPRCLNEQQPLAGQSMPNTIYTDLIAWGTSYLIGISDGTSGWDVVVIDRRDVNAMKMVGRLQIPQIAGFRGRLVGSTLYVAGKDGGVAAVDLSTPTAPGLLSVVDTPGQAFGIEVSGTTAMVADRGAGVTFLDNGSGTLRTIGTQPVGGEAWDVALGGANLYIANDQGLVVLQNVAAPPRIISSMIAVSADGTVSGSTGAITGLGPLSVDVKNSTTGASRTITLNSGAAFSTLITASAGDTITVKATDAYARSAGPVVIGSVPFGTATTQTAIAIGDANFRARTLKVEGTMAVIATYPMYGQASSNLVVFDISNPLPVQTRVVSTVNNVRDLELINGWAYVVGDRFGTIDLRSGTSTINLPCDTSGVENAVAVSGGYAFTAENSGNTDGRIYVYDVSNPAAPRCLSEQQPLLGQSMTNTMYTDLIAWGSNYLVAISDGLSGWDVVVIDRRDVNAMKMVGRLQIPQITGLRGRIVGSTLYVAGEEGGVATVDLSTPSAPRLVSILDTPGQAFGIDVSGPAVMVADRSLGVTFLDNSAGTMRQVGTQAVAGEAWDVALAGTSLYIANDLGLAVLQNVAVAPDIVPSLITIENTTASTATVTGSDHAVVGQAPVQIVIGTSTMTAGGTGSFTATVPARNGDSLSLTATDRLGRSSTKPIGVVPFVTIASDQRGTRDEDANFFARRAVGDGTNVIVTNGNQYGVPPAQGTSRMLLFRQPDASAPATLTAFDAGAGWINDEDVRSGYAYIAADRFAVVDYISSTPVRYFANSDSAGREGAVAVSGNYAYTAEAGANHTGTIFVYDITTPAAPILVKTQAIASATPTDYRKLIASGTGYLFAISPDGNRDLTVIDITTPASPVRVTELDVPGFAAFGGTLSGTTLYLVGGDAGVAIVDVSNPAVPRVLSVIDTPGIAAAIAATTANEAVVADGSTGLTFLDTSDKQRPIVLGSQPLQGNADDVRVFNDQIHVATETRFYIVKRP